MKKLFATVLAAAMTLSLAACSGSPAASTPAASTPAASASGTDYPTKSITMIVPYGAGGTADMVARQLAIGLEQQLGVSIVVENQAGASASIGTQACLDADPDGYTILLAAEALGTYRVMGISEMTYDDFSPIASISSDPKVVVVAGSSPYETIDDLLTDIEANPGRIRMSYTGPGGSGHIQALIMNQYGYEPALTAYSSGSEGITAVLGNQVDFTNSNYSTVASYIESGDLKLLAVASTEPLPAHPDVPTLASRMPGSDELMSIPYSPTSLLVDKDVPAEVQEVLRTATAAAMQDAQFNEFLESNCIDKLFERYTNEEEIRAFFATWESTVSWMLYEAGATVNSPEDYNIPKP